MYTLFITLFFKWGGEIALVFLNASFSMLYMKHIFMILFWTLSNTRSTQKESLALSEISVLSRPNLNLKLILSAKDWYKEQLKWEQTLCILFVFVECCEMSLKNIVHTPINVEKQHRIQEKRVIVLKFVPWIAFNKIVNHHILKNKY